MAKSTPAMNAENISEVEIFVVGVNAWILVFL